MLSSVLLFLNIGTPEMILILFVALMLFGGNKLPELARGLGKGIREFKDASEDVKREINNQINNYEDRKTTEKAVETPIETKTETPAYEPVAGTVSAYTGHSATDAVEEPHVAETHVSAADATFENEITVKPATAETHTADEGHSKAEHTITENKHAE